MPERDPLLCAPEEKAALEAANGVDQVDYISYLVTELRAEEIRESHVLELHKLAVKGIYPCAGSYRNAWRQVRIEGSDHQVPHEALVPNLVSELVERLNRGRVEGLPAVERAAYAMWRLNWIHPFAGGNGRTARAISYLILCLDNRMMLPGTPTVPTLIYERRIGYVKALRAADAGALTRSDSEPNLEAMCRLVEDVVTRQLATVIDKLAGRKGSIEAVTRRSGRWLLDRASYLLRALIKPIRD